MHKRKILLLLAALCLSACQSPEVKERQAREREQYVESFEANVKELQFRAQLAQQRRLASYEKPENLKVWIEMVRYKFEQHFNPTEDMVGHVVKLNVILDDKGNLVSVKQLSSTHDELAKIAKAAIENAAPFPIEGLSDDEKVSARKAILTFAPEDTPVFKMRRERKLKEASNQM
jgi:hypothetical protein